jgi:hypothetical protein
MLRAGDGDVRSAATEVLAEHLDILESDSILERVDVDADATDRDQVETGAGLRCHRVPSFSGCAVKLC